MQHELVGLLEAALQAEWGRPVEVSALSRFHGGAARETWRFTARTDEGSTGLVARRDPGSSLITTSRAAEYHVLARAHAAGLPVPEPLLLDRTGKRLGTPGFVMREVPGGRATSVFEENPYGDARAETGRDIFSAIGRLHALRPDAADSAALPAMPAAARLAHWKSELEAHSLRPEPVARAALRWLEAHVPPPSGPLAIVHGDFRSGNFLVDSDNRLIALLDWEMAHLGDPMEDLAWAMDPMWGHDLPDLVAATLPRDEAISVWEQASGRHFDHAAWAWWRLFAAVQGLAIWVSSAFEVAQRRTVDPVMTFAGIYPYRFHNATAAAMLKALDP
jgi:aminoglycoside phosphotransferase (APT) family kinase protein